VISMSEHIVWVHRGNRLRESDVTSLTRAETGWIWVVVGCVLFVIIISG